MRAPHQILTSAQMRAEEEHLIAAGISVTALMERAGQGAADWVYRVAAGRPVTVLCGPGNNGGDGYVIARVLAERGVAVRVVAPLDPASDAAGSARVRWGGTPVKQASGPVVVDCLFGTGLSRPLSEDLHGLLSDLANAHDYRIAIDLPSGVDSDTGAHLNDRLPGYDLTIALGAWKRAHWLMPAMAQMGARRLVDIGCGAVDGAATLARPRTLSAPSADAHKYSRGLLAVVAGAMPGASLLAARAASHGGAGYVKLIAEHAPDGVPAELVVDQSPLKESLADPRIAALLAGPGLGRDEGARDRLLACLATGKPLVLDADALTMLTPQDIAGRSAPLILTPHAGELKSLLQAFVIDDETRTEAVAQLAEASGAVIVAKGPDTLVQAPGAALAILPPSPSWLSTAGTGDVLAGLIASRLATGAAPREAAIEACQLHAGAARIAGPAFTASTLIEAISPAFAAML